jgi:hypothetical protein
LVDPCHQGFPPAELVGDPWRRYPVDDELGMDDLLRLSEVTVPQVDPPVPERPHLEVMFCTTVSFVSVLSCPALTGWSCASFHLAKSRVNEEIQAHGGLASGVALRP